MSRAGPEAEFTPFLAFFGLVFSLIVFFIVITLSLGYEHYLTDVIVILYEWKRIDFYRHPHKPFHFKKTYRYFYQFAIALFAVILMYPILSPGNPFVAIILVIYVTLLYLYQRYGSSVFSPKDYTIADLFVFFVIVNTFLLGIYQQYGPFTLSPRNHAFAGLYVVFLIIEVIYQWKWEKYFGEISDFKKILTKSFGGFYQEYWKAQMCTEYMLKTLEDLQKTEMKDTKGKIKDIKKEIEDRIPSIIKGMEEVLEDMQEKGIKDTKGKIKDIKEKIEKIKIENIKREISNVMSKIEDIKKPKDEESKIEEIKIEVMKKEIEEIRKQIEEIQKEKTIGNIKKIKENIEKKI